MEKHIFHYNQPFHLELGKTLPSFKIVYCTAGTYHPNKNNVLWVCHALTAPPNVFEWWSGLVGEQDLYNPNDYFIVCASVLGTNFGSTNPQNAPEGFQWEDFPLITIKDIVKAHDLLRKHLGIHHIHTLIGGSSGGIQALEWAVMQPDLCDYLITMCANAKRSPWTIALYASQRMAIEADPTWKERHPEAGKLGLKAARSMAMVAYRSYELYETKQSDPASTYTDFKAESYHRYMGEKFTKGFNAFVYYNLTLIMDTYNLGRNRGGTIAALQQIRAKTLTIGFTSDVLYPIQEQLFLAEHIPDNQLKIIETPYGHDAFLVITEVLSPVIEEFYHS